MKKSVRYYHELALSDSYSFTLFSYWQARKKKERRWRGSFPFWWNSYSSFFYSFFLPSITTLLPFMNLSFRSFSDFYLHLLYRDRYAYRCTRTNTEMYTAMHTIKNEITHVCTQIYLICNNARTHTFLFWFEFGCFLNALVSCRYAYHQ